MYQANVYQVMIGNPSDIIEEVEIAKQVLQKWNIAHSKAHSIVLLPLHWEISSFPTMGERPQQSINKQVADKSDMLVCVFGTKLGTPTGSYQSGTIEEIEEHTRAGKPVMVFFKTSISNISALNLEELKRLQDFKMSIQKNCLYWEFDNAGDFKDIFSDKLQLYINDNLIKPKGNMGTDKAIAKPALSIQSQLTDFDIERLKAWCSAENPQFYQIHFEGGGCTYGLGDVNQYEIKNGREKTEWNSFFERLIDLSLIKIQKYDTKSHPIYELNKTAYDFVDSLL